MRLKSTIVPQSIIPCLQVPWKFLAFDKNLVSRLSMADVSVLDFALKSCKY